MKKIGIILCLFSVISYTASAQETAKKEEEKGNKKKIEIEVKEGEAQPKIIIDGKEYDFELMDLIDKDKIESVTVLKGEEALRAYDAENGVIIIQTKISDGKEKLDIAIRKRVKIETEGDEAPVIIIDGKVSDKQTLDNLSTDDIESIKVYKSEEALKKYNTEAGAILIVTKKKQ